MRFGFAPVQSEPRLDAMIAQARLAESLGFETLWAHEHHSQAMTYPDPLLVLAALAPHTRTARLGTNMLLLPLWHPLRVAEGAAMVDVLSGGRLILGVAAGYAQDEFAAFGVDRKQRGRRMENGLALIRRVWTEDKVHADTADGRLDGYTLFPRPIQRPAPPIYVGGLADAAIRRAARLGDGYLLSAGSTVEEIRRRIAVYQAALRASPTGEHPTGDAPSATRLPIAVNRVVHVAGSRAERDEMTRLLAERFLSAYDRWGHEDVQRLGSPERAVGETARQHFVIGEASECVEQIRVYEEMGVRHVACLMNFGGPVLDLVEASLRRFGEAVLPHFQ
jgi:alkanesulfonate monooxygenase SsuD/methylene tetrahydromethanopterin reductase-like flavin-dependent oxidoreductase (luciferase family)